MYYIYYLAIIFVFVLLFILRKKKNLFATIILTILIASIVVNPILCITAVIEGSKLYFNKVFTSLFPFLILSNLILCYDGIYIYSNIFGKLLCKPLNLPSECSFVLLVSMLCGYPLGAKFACELYDKRIIDYNTCSSLLNIASNPGPLFVIGAVGTSMLKNTQIGYILLFSSYTSCFLIGLIYKKNSLNIKEYHRSVHKNVDINFGYAIRNSIESSIQVCLSIGGFVVFFYVIIKFIQSSYIFSNLILFISNILNVNIAILSGLTLGLIEMTNGCFIISSSYISIILKTVLISFLISFSGISIISQVYSFTYKYNFSLKRYIKIKAIQGVISSITSMIILFLCLHRDKSVVEVFSYQNNTTNNVNIYIFTFQIIILLIMVYKSHYAKKHY